ncbi:GDP-L-fucose synthase family protein [Methanobrevibacter sp.]|uniref:GDP-L-fucose synthase family protein n=1 Tax=Methanobrevibacter sp. TaxID=66852 RepID=UPI002618113A|nr:GDP-L-fucose synthase [uncultured Methanobrevibacter sp.]
MNKKDKIYVAGHNGLVGSAILRKLINNGYSNIITRNRHDLNLLNENEVNNFLKKETPDVIFLAAARVGGIGANIENPSSFLIDNITIQNNVIKNAYKNNVKNLLFIASSSIYPLNSKQPLKEEYLLTGKLESANEGYALAKIIGLKLCEYYNKQYGLNYVTIVPPNIYGINSKFKSENSNVIISLMKKMHEAKLYNYPKVTVWGSGRQRREFIYSDDVADAALYVMKNYCGYFINTGNNIDYSITEIAEIIKEIVGYKGKLYFDKSKPDGRMKRLLDSENSRKIGWNPKISLKYGLELTYEWFKRQYASFEKPIDLDE